MTEIIHVTEVVPLEAHSIRVSFDDGTIKEIDLGELLAAGGVLRMSRSPWNFDGDPVDVIRP